MSALTMGKFVGGRQSLGPRGKDIIGGAISETLANLGQKAGKELETQRALQTAMDPNTSPLMRAFALTKAGSDPLAVQYMKNFTDLQKQNLVNERFLEQQNYRRGREDRLNIRDVQDEYRSRIRELRDSLQEAPRQEKDAIRKTMNDLSNERSRNIARMRAGKEPVFKFLYPQEQEMQVQAPAPTSIGNASAPTQIQQKVKFDSTNPEHVARAEAIRAKVGGDKVKANEILASEFY